MKIIYFNDPLLLKDDCSSILRTGLIQFVNCRVLRNRKFVNEDFWIEKGVIVDPDHIFYVEKRSADLKIDCLENLISPGFIDIQINGAFKYDFSSNADEIDTSIKQVAKRLVRFGVTSFCPTVVSSSPTFYHKALERLRNFDQDENSTIFLGLHLEGPFINRERKGAHFDQYILNGFRNAVDDISSVYGPYLRRVSIITLAPELTFESSMKVIEWLVSNGIIVSLGHSNASISEGERAVNAGASCLTHLFNAMPTFHHRDPGLIGLLTSAKIDPNRTLFFGVISDGVHTHDAALRIAHRTHPDDAIALLGLEEGRHTLGDTSISIQGGRATVEGTDILTGSIRPMDDCVRHFLKASRCELAEALICASLHPAQLLGIDHKKGSLDFGHDADFLILSECFDVLSTYIGSRLVWTKDTFLP